MNAARSAKQKQQQANGTSSVVMTVNENNQTVQRKPAKATTTFPCELTVHMLSSNQLTWIHIYVFIHVKNRGPSYLSISVFLHLHVHICSPFPPLPPLAMVLEESRETKDRTEAKTWEMAVDQVWPGDGVRQEILTFWLPRCLYSWWFHRDNDLQESSFASATGTTSCKLTNSSPLWLI